MKILTSDSDNFLYDQLLRLLYQIKLVQGGTALASTLRRHSDLKNYLIQKQVDRLDFYESRYFIEHDLNHTVIDFDYKKSLQT